MVCKGLDRSIGRIHISPAMYSSLYKCKPMYAEDPRCNSIIYDTNVCVYIHVYMCQQKGTYITKASNELQWRVFSRVPGLYNRKVLGVMKVFRIYIVGEYY